MTIRARLGRLPGLISQRGQVRHLRHRIDRLEAEMQESRRLNRRVAELTDLVGEVLLPAEGRDDERLRRRLEEYRKGL